MLERLFQLKAHNTNVRTEILAGVTTFLAMAYILFVNPSILGETGMDKGAIFVATCLAAAIGSVTMGLIANYPIALAPGMGLNAFFTYTVVLHMGHTWQVALGAVFLSAVLFFLLSIFRIREWIVRSEERRVGKECRSRWSHSRMDREQHPAATAVGHRGGHWSVPGADRLAQRWHRRR